MDKLILCISAEYVAKEAEEKDKNIKDIWCMSGSYIIANERSRNRQIYRIPNGLYFWKRYHIL